MRIYKYRLFPGEAAVVEAPRGAVPLSVGKQADGLLYMWMEVDPVGPIVDHRFVVVGTGHELPPRGSFIGRITDSPFEWHVFRELGEPG